MSRALWALTDSCDVPAVPGVGCLIVPGMSSGLIRRAETSCGCSLGGQISRGGTGNLVRPHLTAKQSRHVICIVHGTQKEHCVIGRALI